MIVVCSIGRKNMGRCEANRKALGLLIQEYEDQRLISARYHKARCQVSKAEGTLEGLCYIFATGLVKLKPLQMQEAMDELKKAREELFLSEYTPRKPQKKYYKKDVDL